MIDIHEVHAVIVAMATFGQRVDLAWLASFEAFATDVLPIPDALLNSNDVRLYRFDPHGPWNRRNCYWGKPSGRRFACDPEMAVQEAARFLALQRKARQWDTWVEAA